MAKVFKLVEHIARKKNVRLVVAPVSKQDSIFLDNINGDENRFLQVVINFLSNSLKFSNQNSEIIIHLEVLEVQKPSDA